VVQRRSKIPLPELASSRTDCRSLLEEEVEGRKKGRVAIPNEEDCKRHGQELHAELVFGVVETREGAHNAVHHQKEEGVEGANVVQNVGIVAC